MPAAIMAQELAQGLARNGADVTVVTGFPNHPYGRLFPGYELKWVTMEDLDGYRLIRGYHPVHPGSAIPIRALLMACKLLAYLIGAYYAPRPEVIISFELEPLIGPILTSLMARKFNAKSVNLFFDLYPDTLKNLYKVNNFASLKSWLCPGKTCLQYLRSDCGFVGGFFPNFDNRERRATGKSNTDTSMVGFPGYCSLSQKQCLAPGNVDTR